MGAERCFSNIKGVHPYLMVARPKVDLGEYGGALELIQQIFDDRNGKLVLDSQIVELRVINT
jgi:hypothetical protein